MNRRPVLALVALSPLFLCPPSIAGNGGGGHSGGAGHGGGHSGGHFGGGGSTGHSIGHSVGHSLGHIFGHRSGGRSTRIEKNSVSRSDNPERSVPFAFLHARTRRRMLFRNRVSGSGLCDPVRFSWHNFLFPGDFDCFSGSFLSDPLFHAGFSGVDFWSDSLGSSGAAGETLDSTGNALPASSEAQASAPSSLSNIEEPVALLQLLDGSMYGLKRYCFEGSNLHYVTTYGGENTLPLERIDFMRTAELNAARGTQFDLTRNSHTP